MDSQELRKGNFVMHPLFKVPTKVTGTGTNAIWIGDTVRGIPLHESTFDPVPFTKEWLGYFNIHVNRTHGFAINPMFECDFGYSIEVAKGLVYVECLYVHEFQNLIFSLTKKELECSFQQESYGSIGDTIEESIDIYKILKNT